MIRFPPPEPTSPMLRHPKGSCWFGPERQQVELKTNLCGVIQKSSNFLSAVTRKKNRSLRNREDWSDSLTCPAEEHWGNSYNERQWSGHWLLQFQVLLVAACCDRVIAKNIVCFKRSTSRFPAVTRSHPHYDKRPLSIGNMVNSNTSLCSNRCN